MPWTYALVCPITRGLWRADQADELQGVPDFLEADRHGRVFAIKHSRGERGRAHQITENRHMLDAVRAVASMVFASPLPKRREAGVRYSGNARRRAKNV
jgi:hypothetical protein